MSQTHFASFHYQGQEYDLSHLAPFSYEYIQAASGSEAEKHYRCVIEFSSHCFTKSPNKRQNETLNDFPVALHYVHRTRKGIQETRIFCFERYQYSLQLPVLIKELSQRKCFFTSADDKFLTVEMRTQEGKILNYEIYFSLKKSSVPHYDAHIFINSAYVRDDSQCVLRRKPISFFVLLRNTILNKRIKKPR